ncbi:MAG: hypothetical protein ACAI35_16455 [Candidatus Methylacidiphilales bacterium]|nr:hypothetical protein [Candidatus Methylacidiphilales bacterium]
MAHLPPTGIESHNKQEAPVAPAVAVPWYRRLEVMLPCIALLVMIGGAVATWLGLGVYARHSWDVELARIKAAGREVSDENAEEKDTARVAVKYPLAVYLGQAGAFVAVVPMDVRNKLAQVEAFQESYLVVDYSVEGHGRPSPEDGATSSFHGLFSTEQNQIQNFAKMVRTGEIPTSALPFIAELPANMPLLTALAREALAAEILSVVDAVKSKEADGPISWEDWFEAARDNTKSPPAYRFGPSNMYYLMQRNYLREIDSNMITLDRIAESRTIPMPRQSEDEMLRTDSGTVSTVSTMLDFTAGALGSNMQRLIMAHAIFRQAHRRNPRDMDELLEQAGLHDKLLNVEGTKLDLVADGTGKSMLQCRLDTELVETAAANFMLLNDYEWRPDSVISVVLYDPEERPSAQSPSASLPLPKFLP